MDNQIRVQVCDDSNTMRKLIRAALETVDGIRIVGESGNGKQALDQTRILNPDVILMDVEMPVMDGIDTVRNLRTSGICTPVIMFSSLTSRGAEATLDALQAGANDFSMKPTGARDLENAINRVRNDLVPKVKQWGLLRSPRSSTKSKQRICSSQLNRKREKANTRDADSRPMNSAYEIVVIGVSTGGPRALETLLSDIPRDFKTPILITQHMPPVFTEMLATRLSQQTGHRVKEAKQGELISPGVILVAPGDFHMLIKNYDDKPGVSLNQDAPENSCRPAVDPLFRSAANVFGAKTLGIVLTGMGTDGKDGARAIKKVGGSIFVQNKESSVVWGMPKQVISAGCADRVLPINEIAPAIEKATKRFWDSQPIV